jgi:hypothetical protein
MSRLSKLMGKPVEVVIEGELLQIHPLKMKDLSVLMKVGSTNPDIQAEAFSKLITKTLMKAVPDSTPEEIEEVAVTHFTILSEAIMKANGLEDGNRATSKKPSTQ